MSIVRGPLSVVTKQGCGVRGILMRLLNPPSPPLQKGGIGLRVVRSPFQPTGFHEIQSRSPPDTPLPTF
jgi:hypothetical protein